MNEIRSHNNSQFFVYIAALNMNFSKTENGSGRHFEIETKKSRRNKVNPFSEDLHALSTSLNWYFFRCEALYLDFESIRESEILLLQRFQPN